MPMKTTLKRIVKYFFLALIIPFYLCYCFFAVIGDSDRVFLSASQFLSLIPGRLGIYMRAAFYRLACSNTSDEISIGFLTLLSHRDTTIRKGVYIGPQCNIGKCTIGKNTLLGSGVHILSGSKQHGFDDLATPIQQQHGSYEKIEIGEDCWLGNGAIIMNAVADQTIVAAGSVVNKSFASASIIGGNPAQLLKERS